MFMRDVRNAFITYIMQKSHTYAASETLSPTYDGAARAGVL